MKGRKMQTLDMLQQLGPSVTTAAALVLPWTALLAMHALSVVYAGTAGSKWQLRG